MDVIVVAGISKGHGEQHSMHRDRLLLRDGQVMTYSNLRRIFGCSTPDEASLQSPYRAGIHLYSFLVRKGINSGLVNYFDLERKNFERFLLEDPKVVALSTSFLTNIRAVKAITAEIRKLAPDIKIVVGGPLIFNSYLLYERRHTDYDTQSCSDDYYFLNKDKQYWEDIDAFIVEEQGEFTLERLVRDVLDGRDFRHLPNLAYYSNDRLVCNERVSEIQDFSWDNIPWEDVPTEYLTPVFPMRASRGCPYKCSFCNFAPNRSFHLKSEEIFEQEVSALFQTDIVKVIRFTDDNLFLSSKHLAKYCQIMTQSAPGMKWTSLIRASSITAENVHWIRKSGCVLAQIGIESGDAGMLKLMKKRAIPDDYRRAIDLLNTEGISTQLYIIVGFPGETCETLENTINFLNDLNQGYSTVNTLFVFPFVFFPLSPIFEPKKARAFHLTGYMSHWKHDTMDSEQALEHAKTMYDHVPNLYPNYGVEELYLTNLAKIKRMYELRTEIKKAEGDSSQSDMTGALWKELETIVRS